jgi:peptide chain release factor 2
VSPSPSSKSSEVFFDYEQKKKQIEDLNRDLSTPEIWQDQKKSQTLQQTKKRLERVVQSVAGLYAQKEEIDTLLDLAKEGEDVDKDFDASLAAFAKRLDEAELQTLFYETDDTRNAILTIHPGAGGTESQDWASFLLRMYLRYAERKGYKTEVLDMQPGEEAGLKSVTVRIEGDYVFGNLSQETGSSASRPSTPTSAATRRSPRSSSTPKSTMTSTSPSAPTSSGSTPTGPEARAASM